MRIHGPVGAIILLVGGLASSGCRESAVLPRIPESSGVTDEAPVARITLTAESRATIETFCGNCHAMPRPASSPKGEWLGEIEQGFSLYEFSARTDLELPSQASVVEYFESQAPEKFVIAEVTEGLPPCSLVLEPQAVRLAGSRPPGVTNVRWLDLGGGGGRSLVYCDIGTGAVKSHGPGETRKLATLLQPVHAETCDLDADGLIDLVVADIGEFNANDSDLGRVMWLRRTSEADERYESIVLAEGLSRVADVRPGDFDGDGDTDVLVAEFGWRMTGKVFLLINEGKANDDGPLQFGMKVIDGRNGPVHIPPLDLEGDGDLDFIALISQEHEIVEAFINDGHGNFTPQVVWRAPDPAYGSSGIQLVDMDADGDTDVLYTNGDSFDRGYKPHHGIQWLENPGLVDGIQSFPFIHHAVANMPGVLNAKAADMDGDGDVDIVACSLLAGDITREFAAAGVTSLMMLTQTEPGTFMASKLESGLYNHISLELDDFDNDGRTDIAVGNFLRDGSASEPDLTIWWNRP